jgi:RHH-type proline utilization regulon transcriptional repressor/proline dehydrogenase/delta 1-pyrroline-5-carboxylate dehydrogenase
VANLSVKVSALTPHLRPHAPELGAADAAARLEGLMDHAASAGAHLHVDMESLDSREAVTGLVLALLEQPRFAEGPSTGVVVQSYLRDASVQCDALIAAARKLGARKHPLVIRLVKGAYWDHELAEAEQRGWNSPVFEDKGESDRCFERLTRRLLEARADGVPVRPAIASHNLRSIAHAVATARSFGLEGRELELQVLRGLGDDLARALVANGLPVRMYCPVGDLVAGIAYLVRRLLENSSNEGFLHAQATGASLEELLRAP